MRAAIASLSVDHTTAELFEALDAAGVPALLLKGPSVARWLYEDPNKRPYGDTDVLVPLERESDAEAVLRSLGFKAAPGTGEPDPEGVAVNHIWSRGSETVEIHVTLVGVRAPRDAVWSALSSDAESLRVGGRDVAVGRTAVRALHLVLHAAQHGRAAAKPLEDLRRGLERVPEVVWQEAAELAARLDARPAFAVGLNLLPDGLALHARLGLPPASDVESALRAENADLALGWERLARLPSRRARAGRLLRVIFPAPSFMRWWTPIARRGRLGLVLSYFWRIGWLIARGPGAFLTWSRARRRRL